MWLATKWNCVQPSGSQSDPSGMEQLNMLTIIGLRSVACVYAILDFSNLDKLLVNSFRVALC
jgi:hypothetical protein